MGVVSLRDMPYNRRFDFLWKLVELRKPFILYGPAGSGKSYIGLKIIEKFVSNYFGLGNTSIFKLQDLDDELIGKLFRGEAEIRGLYIAGSSNVTKFDVLGGRTLSSGSYVRRPGLLSYFRSNGGIVFFDEISSMPPNFTILLNEIIDSIIRGDCHEDFFIFFAGNPSSYAGVEEIPTSTLERLILVYYDYYPIEDEIRILTDMLRRKLNMDDKSLSIYARFIVHLVRRLRSILASAGYRDIPLSVRSMENLAVSIIVLAGSSDGFEKDPRRLENLYVLLHGDLPKSKADIDKDKDISALLDLFGDLGIGPKTIRSAILMLGPFAEYISDKNFANMVTSIV